MTTVILTGLILLAIVLLVIYALCSITSRGSDPEAEEWEKRLKEIEKRYPK